MQFTRYPHYPQFWILCKITVFESFITIFAHVVQTNSSFVQVKVLLSFDIKIKDDKMSEISSIKTIQISLFLKPLKSRKNTFYNRWERIVKEKLSVSKIFLKTLPCPLM